jgi:spermidine synthase
MTTKPMTKHMVSLPVEGVLVLCSLALLITLDIVWGAPFFDRLGNSRLTFVTLLLFPFLLGVALLRRRWELLGSTLACWWPVLGVLVVYESLKHLHANRITEFLGIAPKDGVMLAADKLMFGKALPLWFDGWTWGPFQQLMWIFYVWVYYLGPALLLGYAFFVREDRVLFVRLRRGLVLGLLGGYIIYLIVPVAGPLFEIGAQFRYPILSQPVLQRLTFSTLRYNWDCFPSLHTAVPLLLSLLAWRRMSAVLRAVCCISTFAVALSCLTLRFHYGIDILAGILWAVLVWGMVALIERMKWSFEIMVPSPWTKWRPLRARLRLLSIFFTATGLAALLVEQAFEKLLGTLLGASAYSAATVLAVYFLGLTLGGVAYGRLLRPMASHPLRLYALLEGGVGAWTLVLYLAFDKLIPIFVPVLSLSSGSFWLLQGLRLGVAGCWILPSTFLMGASFPAMVDTLKRMGIPHHEKAMTRFYGLNLFGAIAGAILGPYFAFPILGVDGTLLAVFLLNIAVCLSALALDRGTRPRKITPPVLLSGALEGGLGWKRLRILGAVAFASGFIFFSLEVVWTHLIGAVLGNSVYAFSAMLGLVLGGLGAGSALAALLWPKRKKLTAAVPGTLFLLSAFLLTISNGLWPGIPHALAVWGGSLQTFWQGEILKWIQAAILLFPSATVLGMAYPSLFRLDRFPEHARGRAAGLLGALNSVGCILGAIATGFWLIPHAGSEATLQVLTLMCVSCGLILVASYSIGAHRSILLALGAAVLFLASAQPPWNRLALTSGEHVYFARNQVFPQSQLLFFQEDTLGGITTVVSNPAGTRGETHSYLTLLTNGKFQGNDAWEVRAQTGFALTPMLYSSGRDRALVIGLGTGQSAHVVQCMGFKSVDIAEIAPGMVEAARTYFKRVNGGVLDMPNVYMHIEDGRNFLLLTHEQYDLVTMEISSVWFAGATNLYSQEFYRLAQSKLRPGGVFQQLIQLHHIGYRELGTAIATLRSVFPNVSFWVVGGQGILVASEGPQLVQPAFLANLESRGASLGWSETEGRSRIKELLSSRLLAPEDVTNFVAHHNIRINTDRNRLLEYWTPRYNLVRTNLAVENVYLLGRSSTFSPPLFSAECKGPFSEIGRQLTENDLRRYFGLSTLPSRSQENNGG